MVSLVVSISLASLNLFTFTRDVPMTIGAGTVNIERVIDDKAWVESPMQTLQTFVGAAVFPNVGNSDSGQFDFIGRMRMVFGPEAVFETEIVDVRTIFSDSDMATLRADIATWGYSSQIPCPHNHGTLCEVYVAWNRDRTRESGIRMIAIRFGEAEYAFIDDSAVTEG